MILKALYEVYERLESDPEYGIAAPGRSYQKVTFIVTLERDGTLFDFQDARQPIGRRMAPRRVRVLGTTKISGSGLNPCFLWDTPGYMLGWDSDDAARAKRTFEAFRDKHLALESEIGLVEYSAVCRFLKSWDPDRCAAYPILKEIGSGFGSFQIRGETRYVHEHPDIAAWWDRQPWLENPGPPGQCLVTGKTAPIARLHLKIKGVACPKPPPGGATIAGFNDPSYWSYGLTQSFNAPVSDIAAHRYATALNALLDGPRRDKHRLVVGHTTVVFWTESPTVLEDIFLPFAVGEWDSVISNEAQDESVRGKLAAFLRALRMGREAYGDLDTNAERTKYYILGLAAPTPARIAVRFFHQGTLAELLENLRRHHNDIGIERCFGEGSKRPEPEFPAIGLLLDQTCPIKSNRWPDKDKIPPLLAGTLLESIVTGIRYPEGLYAAVMRRIVADREVNYPRACVIKGYLVRNLGKEIPMGLDTSRIEPSYRLGRLFAALEKTQKDALGEKIKATIRDRFYSSASATPGAVFPRLLRTYQHHLANPNFGVGKKINREKLVQEILEPLAGIPAHFGLTDQGLFALGYYHQINAFYTSKDISVANSES